MLGSARLRSALATGLLRAFAAVALGIAVLATKIAILDATGVDVGYSVLVPAPVIGALLWGLGPGAVATLVVGAGNLYLFIVPLADGRVASSEWVKLVLFGIVGLLGSLIGEALRIARLRAVRQRDLAEDARERAERLTSAATSLATAVTPADAAAAAIRHAVGQMRGLGGAVVLAGPDDSTFEPVATAGPVATDEVEGRHSSPSSAEPHDPEARFVSELVHVASTAAESGFERTTSTDPPTRLVALPLRSTSGAHLGALGVVVPAEREIGVEERGLLRALADLAGQAIERARLYDDETRLIAELRERQALREAFTGVLSHELRTPVTTIYGATQLLVRGVTEEKQRELLVDARDEAARLHRMVEDLLVLTRAERGTLQLEPEPVLVQRVAPIVAHEVEQRFARAEIHVKLGGALPPVLADETGLRQVLRNLLVNGIRYGDPPVELLARPDGAFVEIVVRDQGPGLLEGEVDELFTLFYRAPSTARRSPGTGIGLYIVKQLVETMGGSVAATLDSGGLAFRIRLPVAEPEAETAVADREAADAVNGHRAIRPADQPESVVADG